MTSAEAAECRIFHTVEAPTSPGGVLSGQAHDQGANTGRNGRSASSDGLGGPPASDEVVGAGAGSWPG